MDSLLADAPSAVLHHRHRQPLRVKPVTLFGCWAATLVHAIGRCGISGSMLPRRSPGSRAPTGAALWPTHSIRRHLSKVQREVLQVAQLKRLCTSAKPGTAQQFFLCAGESVFWHNALTDHDDPCAGASSCAI